MHAPARTALLFASAGHALCHGSKFVLAVGLLSAAAEFGTGRAGLGTALTAYGLGIGLFAVPAGLLSDRLGPTRVLLLYLWALAGAALLCWWAPTLGAFSVAHAALGAAAGLYHPPGLTLLSLSSARAERGPVMGWHGVLGQLGPVVAPLVAAWTAVWGWRAGYLALAASAAALALLGHALAARGRLLRARPEVHEPAAAGRLDRGALLLLLAVMSLNGFAMDGFQSLFPSTVERLGIAPFAGARLGEKQVTALILALSMVGPWLGGLLARGADGARRYAWLMLGLAPPLLLAAGSLQRPALAFVGFAVFGMQGYLLQPVENHLLAEYTGSARRGAAYALKFSVAWGLGAAAPGLVLWLVDSEWGRARGGDAVGYAALGGVAALAAGGAWLFVRRQARAGGTAPAR